MRRLLLPSLLFLSFQLFSQSSGHFPLNVGDMWEFNGFALGHQRMRTLQDSLLPNGKNYSFISTVEGIGEDYLYRQEEDSVFLYHDVSGREIKVFDFSAQVGDTICEYIFYHDPDSTFIDTTRIILLSKGFGDYFGSVRGYWTFSMDWNTAFLDEEQVFTVCDSIGVFSIFYSFMGVSQSLDGALIDGREYGMITGIGLETGNPPKVYLLLGNYPNPFNPSTMLEYKTSSSGKVELRIFDILGRVVRELVDEVQPSGRYQVPWDGLDHSGNRVSSGVFFAYFSVDGVQQIHKMVLSR